MGFLISKPLNPDEFIDYSSYVDNERDMIDISTEQDCQVKDQQQHKHFDDFENFFDSATDAACSSNSPTMLIELTMENILDIEDQLDFYEKVSLVYLLFDDPHIALQELDKLLNKGSQNILYNWTMGQNVLSPKWKEKFIEALCIIQNYQIVRRLGHLPEDLKMRFLPHYMFATVHVNKVRKALYLLSEHLTESETQKILNLVYADFIRMGLEFKMFNSSYLEFFLLYWEKVEYITQDNLNNLCSVLKQLEYFEMVSKLKKTVTPLTATFTLSNNEKVEKNNQTSTKTIDSNDNKKKSSKIFEGILNCASNLSDLKSMESMDTFINIDDNNNYKTDPENPGVCLIINQEDFYTEIDPEYKNLLPPNGKKFESRLGTQKDKKDLESTFKMFNFKTEVADNLTHVEIIDKIKEVVQRITIESSLFICIMSHGDEGVIYGINSCRVLVKDIKHLMCSKNVKNLLGKPKGLILQSCQGNRCQKMAGEDESYNTTDSPSCSNNQEKVPPSADLFTFWATVPGYGAIRNTKTGSWFIQSLCDKMKTLNNKCHFEDICTAVINDVCRKKWKKNEEKVAMVPLKDSSWRKRFYLPPICSN